MCLSYKYVLTCVNKYTNKQKTQLGRKWKNRRLINMAYVLKMEYVSKINIFGLKMMVKSGLEKIFLKFLHAQGLFQTT